MDNLAAPLSPDVRAIIARLRLVVFDFDGVFTDNAVYVSEDGAESVRCWRGDGMGLRKLERLGLRLLVVSTEPNPVVGARCRKLALACVQGCADKRAALIEQAAAREISLQDAAYVGNDINDAECLRAVALPILVADAAPAVRSLARWTTSARGGYGAVREVCDRMEEVLLPLGSHGSR